MDAFWDTVAPPIAAGGTGGSGTRVLTQVLSAAGVFMGAHLNRAGDSLDLADFDWRWGKPYLEAERAGIPAPTEMMDSELPDSVREHLGDFDAGVAGWGWKHPHAYLLLPWLDSAIPRLRFVHLVRDGRRVARSRNQKQPLHYGHAVFGDRAADWGQPELALRFWDWANGRAADYGERCMNGRYLRLRFEDICERPREACARLIEFAIDAEPPAAMLDDAAALVKPPDPVAEPLPAELEAVARAGLERFGYV